MSEPQGKCQRIDELPNRGVTPLREKMNPNNPKSPHNTFHVPRSSLLAPRSPLPALRSTPHLPLFLFLLALYLLTYTPHINSSDGLAMFSTAESIVRRGALDIEQIRWMGLQQGTYGLDGLLYSRKGIGLPVGLLPLTWLGLVLPWFGPVSVSLLFNAIVTALTGVLLLAYLQALGFSRRTGLFVALTFGLTTLAWPYAKSLFSDPFSGFLLLAAAYALLKTSRGAEGQRSRGANSLSPAPPLLYPFLAGLLLGWNVATRYAEIVFLPVYGLLLLYYLGLGVGGQGSVLSWLWPRPPAPNPWPPILAFSAPLLLTGLGLITFNLSRYGDPFNTGYLPNETFSAVLWQGLLGQLVSPGRGLLLYCPIFSLSFWGLPAFFRRFRPEAVLALAVIVIHLLLYGKWFMWHGGFAWGPRFMIPTLPFWAIFLAPVVARAFPEVPPPIPRDKKGVEASAGLGLETPTNPTGRLRTASTPQEQVNGPRSTVNGRLRLIFLTLAVLSLMPQLLTATIDFTSFQGYLLDTGLPLFAPQTFFDPRYSPLLHAWTFITPTSLDLAWAWQGQINGWLLAMLVANVVITGLYLKRRMANLRTHRADVANERTAPHSSAPPLLRSPAPPLPRSLAPLLLCPSALLSLLSTLLALFFLLVHTHSLSPEPLQEAVTALNEAVRPADAVITNDPEMAMPFAERYKGRAPVLGLNNGGFPLPDQVNRRLAEITAQHPQVWWLPNWLPPEESAIEQTLLSTGFRARHENFGTQRLALFAFPPNLSSRVTNVTFAGLITLIQVAYPPRSASGGAFPVELQWQGLAPIGQDYHVFIHLVADDGQIVAQADGQPVLWLRPTSTWTAGETIIDRHGLWIPAQVRPGPYQLSLGLYTPASGQRLSRSDGEDAVKFTITIQ